jgi:WD40 repeat protein
LSASDDGTVKIWPASNEVTDAIKELKKPGVQQTLYPFLCCAYSPDGRRIAAGSADADIELWDGQGYGHIASLSGHTAFVYSCNFSVNSSRLVSASEDGTIKVWDMAQNAKKISDGQPLLSRRFDINFTGKDIATYTAIALDTNDQKLKVFKGKSVEDFPVTSIVKSWCLSNAGNQIALGFRNGNVEV